MKPVDRVRESRKHLRRALVEAQDNLCAHCFDPMAADSEVSNPDRATLDHVFPQRTGGTDATCVAVHSRCNVRKGSRPPTGCELLVLTCIRLRVASSPRLTAIVGTALQVLGNVPSWAAFGRLQRCDCGECRALDAKHPSEGTQLLLPIVRRSS